MAKTTLVLKIPFATVSMGEAVDEAIVSFDDSPDLPPSLTEAMTKLGLELRSHFNLSNEDCFLVEGKLEALVVTIGFIDYLKKEGQIRLV